LLEAGCTQEEIELAEQSGTLDLLALDRLFVPGERKFTLSQVARDSGVPVELVRRIWRSLGFLDVGDNDVVFTDLDRSALDLLTTLVGEGLADVDQIIQGARVVGSSMARIAEATLGEDLDRLIAEDDSLESVADFVEVTAAAIPAQAELMEFAWRRHIQEAIRRRILHRSSSAGSDPEGDVAVGFADIVGFTALSQNLPPADLTEVIQHFEIASLDITTSESGRIVKMLGDEVMFVADHPGAALRIGLRLADFCREDEILSAVRVGIALGWVLPAEGDLFGPTVNLASRLVKMADPSQILVNAAMIDQISEASRAVFRFEDHRERDLKGFGAVATATCQWQFT
jgi:adenylate cyclase